MIKKFYARLYGSSQNTTVISKNTQIYHGHTKFITMELPASQTMKV